MANKTIKSASIPSTIPAENRRKELVQVYKDEPKRTVQISPLYKDYLGKVIQVSINGISIAVPVDGTRHEIPKSFANEVDSRIMAIDATINKASLMSNVSKNVERYPGESGMF